MGLQEIKEKIYIKTGATPGHQSREVNKHWNPPSHLKDI